MFNKNEIKDMKNKFLTYRVFEIEYKKYELISQTKKYHWS